MLIKRQNRQLLCKAGGTRPTSALLPEGAQPIPPATVLIKAAGGVCVCLRMPRAERGAQVSSGIGTMNLFPDPGNKPAKSVWPGGGSGICRHLGCGKAAVHGHLAGSGHRGPVAVCAY